MHLQLLVVVETVTIMRCFFCMFEIVLMPKSHNKLKMYGFTVVYVRSSYYFRHILFLSCPLARFLTGLYIAVNKVNLPVTRALVRTRTTIEKYIFHSQRIHKPRQLHSTYTSSYIENRAWLHNPPEPLPTINSSPLSPLFGVIWNSKCSVPT